MKQELNRKQMERNSTKVSHSMIYLGEKLKNFPNQKNFPLGKSVFPEGPGKRNKYLNH